MNKEIKKIGSNLELKGIVIHQIFKDANIRHVGFKQADSLIKIDEKEKIFIGKLNKAYYKRSSPVYGIFEGSNPKFKDCLIEYLVSEDFLDFSIKASMHYKQILENTISATGGFLIFADFTIAENSNRYLLVLTINNKDGYVVSESDLTLKDIKNLDLSKVDVACMINLTKWQNIEKGINTEGKTYLSFVRGMKNISFYFMSFIDCNNKTTNTESTKSLIKAFDDYATEMKYEREYKIKKRNEIYDYCEVCMDNKKEIELSAISAILDIEKPNDFLEYAADEKFGVSATIKGDKALLRKMKYIMYKGDKYRLEFDSGLLGKDVIFNSQKKELTFKKIPNELINQIIG